MEFKDLGMREEILKTLEEIGFDKPTPVQEKIVPLALKGQNICGRSPTGSGKTHAFLLPIFNSIDTELSKVQAVILTPTRELAKQIYEMARPFAINLNLKIMLLSSGLDRNRMLEDINNTPQIVIGTPGRVMDIAFTKASLNITSAKVCVLDEADMILEAGFMDEVGYIIESFKESTQFLCFSASLPQNLLHFLAKYIGNIEYINLASDASITAKNVQHIAVPTRNRDRLSVLDNLVSSINPYLLLVFASRKEDVEKIYKYFLNKRKDVAMIHGDMSATARKTTMKRIVEGRYSLVVASDLAARGIDITGVSCVINYDLPYEEDFYFHRAGRTGRYEATGICYTLYDKEEVGKLERLAKRGIKFANGEFVNGEWRELKPLIKPKTKKPHPVNDEIQKAVNKHKKEPVKPNYKKKLKYEIERIKRKHKREVIKKDIERQKLERYKQNSREKSKKV